MINEEIENLINEHISMYNSCTKQDLEYLYVPFKFYNNLLDYYKTIPNVSGHNTFQYDASYGKLSIFPTLSKIFLYTEELLNIDDLEKIKYNREYNKKLEKLLEE